MNTCSSCNINNTVLHARNFRANNTVATETNNENNLGAINFDPQSVVDKVLQDIQTETSKEHNKTAIAVGTGVLLLSLFVAVLNPKASPKLFEKLKMMKTEAVTKLDKSKDNFITSKIYKLFAKGVDAVSRFMSFTCNFNTVKDTYFNKLCTETKTFGRIKNQRLNNILQKTDKIFLKIVKKPYESITKAADKLAKYSVKLKYKKAAKNMNKLEQAIETYKHKLPSDKQKILEQKLAELKTARTAFTEDCVNERLTKQGEILSDINKQVRKHISEYGHGFTGKVSKDAKHVNDNMSFWAQDIVKPARDKINAEGKSMVDNLIGGGDKKGIYNELYELFAGSLTEGEEAVLRKTIAKSGKKLRVANKSECAGYFDKKRDLTIGSAPTDVVSALFGITAGSLVIATANDKDSRISRLLTGVIPATAGMGTNLAMTAMLISGPKGMLIGSAAGVLMSRIGSKINKFRLSLKQDLTNNKNMEVDNV